MWLPIPTLPRNTGASWSGACPGKEIWLLKKLKAEGAGLVEIGVFDTPYPDSHLYAVTLAP